MATVTITREVSLESMELSTAIVKSDKQIELGDAPSLPLDLIKLFEKYQETTGHELTSTKHVQNSPFEGIDQPTPAPTRDPSSEDARSKAIPQVTRLATPPLSVNLEPEPFANRDGFVLTPDADIRSGILQDSRLPLPKVPAQSIKEEQQPPVETPAISLDVVTRVLTIRSKNVFSRFASLLKQHRIAKELCVFDNLTVPGDITRVWNKRLKKEVETILCQRACSSAESQGLTMQLDLVMASTSRENPTPSILVYCGSNRMRKGLSSALRSSRRVEKSGLPYFVIVKDDLRYLNKGQQVENALIKAKFQPWSTHQNLYGIPAVLFNTKSTKNSDIQGSVRFTIGGHIYIDDELFWLTAGHPFVPSRRLEHRHKRGSRISGNKRKNGIHNRHLDTLGYSFIGLRGISMILDSPYSTSRLEAQSAVAGNPDWALLFPGSQEPLSPLDMPESYNGEVIARSILPLAKLVAGQVFVAAGSGSRTGILSQNPVSILLDDSFRDVRRIFFDGSALEPGDSGSWVIQHQQLCGIIIAGRSSESCAYMVPIEEIFASITSCFPKCSIRLRHGDREVETELLLPARPSQMRSEPSPSAQDVISGETRSAGHHPAKQVRFSKPTQAEILDHPIPRARFLPLLYRLFPKVNAAASTLTESTRPTTLNTPVNVIDEPARIKPLSSWAWASPLSCLRAQTTIVFGEKLRSGKRKPLRYYPRSPARQRRDLRRFSQE